MEENERDIVVFEDEDNNEIELDIVRYFEHNGEEYAILMDFNGALHEDHVHDDHCCEDELCDCETEMYIMKVVSDGEYEEFVPVEEELFDELIDVVENLPDEDDE